MDRRRFVVAMGGAATWPLAARAQQAATPVIGMLVPAPNVLEEKRINAFRQGLAESGYVEGQNVALEYRLAEGQYDRLPALAADLVRRQVNVIVVPFTTSGAIAARAIKTTIPIVFGIGDDPVKHGLVESLARPGGNVTGVSYFSAPLGPKRLGLMRELIPGATRFVLLVNPSNATAAGMVKDVREAGIAGGLDIRIMNATSIREIETAFEALARERPQALLLGNDPVFTTRRVQIVLLAARHGIPAIYSIREFAEAGGLMSYGNSIVDISRQIGLYTGRVLRGAKPADLPVAQATKFEFVINLSAARILGVEIPPMLLARADEVIE